MAAQQFECTICSDLKSEDQPHTIEESPICIECVEETVLPLFEKALKFEHWYPPRWGQATVIDITSFEDVLGREFLARYAKREEEYNTEIGLRIYCSHKIISREEDDTDTINVLDVVPVSGMKTERCNKFLGSKDGKDYLRCTRCTGLVCADCGTALTDTEMLHDCDTSSRAETDEAFDGLEKGLSWQLCPHCDRKVELAEACNEITCNCGQKFCFLCGEALPAAGITQHFSPGGCPRFGNPASAGAVFDQPPRAFTPEQWNEAVTTAVQAHAVNGVPPDIDHNLQIIMDRDQLRRLANDLGEQQHQENVFWRHETSLLLTSVSEGLDLMLIGSFSPLFLLPEIIANFERNLGAIEILHDRVPQAWLFQHPEVVQITADVVEEVEELMEEMQERVNQAEFWQEIARPVGNM